MAQYSHGDDSIEVEITDRESYRGTEVVQIEAVEDGVELSDDAGEPPWVEVSEVDDE